MPDAVQSFEDYRGLIENGPALPIRITFIPNFPELLREGEGSAVDAIVRNSVDYLALVDTGASHTCVDDTLAQELQLPKVSEGNVAGVNSVETVPIYWAHIYIDILKMGIFGFVFGVNLRKNGQDFDALLGRHFLRDIKMTYDGCLGRVEFDKYLPIYESASDE